MDLRQKRLTAEEWESLEIPVSVEEKKILNLICNGYDNVNVSYNETLSIISYVKIKASDLDIYHIYFYDKYFKNIIDSLFAAHNCVKDKKKTKKKKKGKLKKADQIRITNSNKKIEHMRSKIFEFILLNIVKKFFEGDISKRSYYYYTLSQLMHYKIVDVNTLLMADIKHLLMVFENKIKKKKLMERAWEYIEGNNILRIYQDIHLYKHQKQLFTFCKNKGPKLILYQAPTGTGKTISPLGLVKKHKLIFVCAAKHVGLQLAKSCISLGIKIAVAFGCQDPGGIRLHYFAAKDFVKNRRTGGIFRVDNAVGDNVEIIISDVMSYLPAMRYMLAFNKKEDIIWYWDEPTITLDYETHKYHTILQKNWQENDIPNIVLSSATLPRQEEIAPCLQNFMVKFNSTNIYNIISHDCTRTIPILDSQSYIVLPHFIFSDFVELKKSISHIKKYKTLLRHFDLKGVCSFITYINKRYKIRENLKLENYFENIGDITSISLKEYYLKLLLFTKANYDEIYTYFQNKREKRYPSTIKITTNDSHTLTCGPTIYLAEDVEKIAKFCLQIAAIPAEILQRIMVNINYNEKIRAEIEKIEKEITKNTDSKACEGMDKKEQRGVSRESGKKSILLTRQMDYLRTQIRPIQLPSEFVPNSFEHLRKWGVENTQKVFRGNINDAIVEKIMLLDVEPIWKILLMMGIGVFAKHKCVDYVTIMKELAHKQRLYLIIASSDYIYGTNYQFCHGYIGKDLENLTQEKLIQAFGRVGRRNIMGEYSLRLRNDKLIMRLFQKSQNKIEVMNMNKLFGI